MLHLTLEGEGHSVDVAVDGAQALDLLQEGRYRVLLLDLLLPRLDGRDVLHALRAAPALRPPAVIVLSALQQRPDVLAALEAGADDYVTKPFDVATRRRGSRGSRRRCCAGCCRPPPTASRSGAP